MLQLRGRIGFFCLFLNNQSQITDKSSPSLSAFLCDLGALAVNLFGKNRRCEVASPYRLETRIKIQEKKPPLHFIPLQCSMFNASSNHLENLLGCRAIYNLFSLPLLSRDRHRVGPLLGRFSRDYPGVFVDGYTRREPSRRKCTGSKIGGDRISCHQLPQADLLLGQSAGDD